MHRDGPILPELLLGLVHLPDEVDEALARLGHALLWPVCELELPDRPRLPILGEVAEAGVRAGASGSSPPGQAESAVAQVSTLRSLHRGHPGKWACTPTAHFRFLQLELGHHKGSPTTGAPAALQTSFCTNIHTPLSTHPGICDLEFTQDILGHVVLSHWVNDEVLVASRALRGPVLVALFLWTEGPAPRSGGEKVGRGAPGFRGFGGRMPQVVIMGSEADRAGRGRTR